MAHCTWPPAAVCPIPSQLGFASIWKMSGWLAAAFSDWLGVSAMFDTSCPSRDDPLKEYSILFPNKLNTQELFYCAMKKYWSVHLSWYTRRSPSIFLCFETSISNSKRSTERNRFYGRKKDSSKSARSRHYYLAKSASIPNPSGVQESVVGKNERCLCRSSLGDEVVNNLDLI